MQGEKTNSVSDTTVVPEVCFNIGNRAEPSQITQRPNCGPQSGQVRGNIQTRECDMHLGLCMKDLAT